MSHKQKKEAIIKLKQQKKIQIIIKFLRKAKKKKKRKKIKI